MWYRSWIEVRWRFVLMLLVNTFIGALLADDVATPDAWRHRLNNVLPMIFAMNAIVLAGSGVATQMSQRPGQVVHTSMLFLLSLPVTRRRLVLVRQAVGAAAALLVVLTTLAGFAVAAPEFRLALPLEIAFAYLASVVPVVLTAYSVSALLATVLDQLWQTYAAMAVVGSVLGGVPATRYWRRVFESVQQSGAELTTVSDGWLLLLGAGVVCAGISMALAFASVRVVQRKQF